MIARSVLGKGEKQLKAIKQATSPTMRRRTFNRQCGRIPQPMIVRMTIEVKTSNRNGQFSGVFEGQDVAGVCVFKKLSWLIGFDESFAQRSQTRNEIEHKAIVMPIEKDRYGCTVAEVFVKKPNSQEEIFVNGELVTAGMSK